MTSPMPPALRATLLHALAEALEDQYPGVIAVPLTPDHAPSPGARVLPGAPPADREPLGDVRVPRPRRRRRDNDSVDH